MSAPAHLQPGVILQVPQDRLLDALRHVVGGGSDPSAAAARRFLEFIRSQRLDADQCWAVAGDHGQLRPALIALPNSGRTAMLFVTAPRYPEEVATLARLIGHAHRSLDHRRIALTQVLMEPDEPLTAAAFEQAGYTRLAVLNYMERRVSRAAGVPEPQWPAEVRLLHYEPPLEPLFKEALLQSYRDTLDCPALCGLRNIDDVLADHVGAGVQDPLLWTLVLWNQQPAAVLLLNPLADGESVELSYLGVGAGYRGRGLGRRLMALALRQLSERPYTRFTLAVDQDNFPALSLYKSFGLARTDRRLAYIRPVPDDE
ncbi:MAG: GNAT family N-acetyltransferase [Phycisphaerales bacterium]|nr:GNAT family N-acetyltransferase [Phycisphaerales bacterium]